jgi:sensor histidine kinase YesM
VLTVADTGVGFRTSGGTGIGLANTRARLLSTYGPRAWLALRANEPQGVVAQLHLPLSTRAG